MIIVKDLIKDYPDGTRALSGVSFTIKKGEFVSIMGPSGSGKSTLLHVLSFLDRPTAGIYSFSGKNINDYSNDDLAHIRNGEMGFVFQSFNLLSRSSVYENVELPLLYSPLPVQNRKAVIENAIKAVGLEEKLHTEAGKLSGGQRQRVAIARALVNNPETIFADEPTGNLDSKSGAQIMDILKRMNDQGKTVVLVTHETYTSEFARRLIKIKDGLVEFDGPITARATVDGFFK